jgi:hypothetical protein
MGHFDKLRSVEFKGKALTLSGREISRLAPSFDGLTVGAVATAATIDAAKDQISVNPFTGAAAQAVTLPSAVEGSVVVFVMAVDTTGGTEALSFACAGSDVFKTGSVVESRAANVLTYDTSVADETTLTYTPANAVTNYISQGSKFTFWCSDNGVWNVSLEAKANPASTGLTGATVFS